MLKDEREWQRTRWLATLLINVQLPPDKNYAPEDLIKLPSDKLIKVAKPIPTKDEMMAAFERYRKD